MRPTEKQLAALFLAEADGYIRPASQTHAHRCATTCGRLSKTVAVCVRQGWLKQIPGQRFQITDAGREFVPSRPAPRSDGVEWARF